MIWPSVSPFDHCETIAALTTAISRLTPLANEATRLVRSSSTYGSRSAAALQQIMWWKPSIVSRASTSSGTPVSSAATMTVLALVSVSRPIVMSLAIVRADGIQCSVSSSAASARRWRVAESIRSTLNTNAAALSTLPKDGPEFSVKEWVQSEHEDGSILFVSARYVDLPTVRILLTLWLDTAINSMMAMPVSPHNVRLWFLFDELGALHRLTAKLVTIGGILMCLALPGAAAAQYMGAGGTIIDEKSGIEQCATPLGTAAVVEQKRAPGPEANLPPQFAALMAMARAQQGGADIDPLPLLKFIAAKSQCFKVVDRGTAFDAIQAERRIAQAGQTRGPAPGATLQASDFVLVAQIVYKDSNAGGAGGVGLLVRAAASSNRGRKPKPC